MGKNSTVVAISFSPPDMLIRARARARAQGFKNSFSAYVTKLVEDDIALHDRPSSDYGQQAAKGVVDAAAAYARGEGSEPQQPKKPINYRVGRRSKKKPHV